MAKITISLEQNDTKELKEISFSLSPPRALIYGILVISALYLTKPTVDYHVNSVFSKLSNVQIASLKDHNIPLHFSDSIIATNTTVNGQLLSIGAMKYVYVVPKQLEYIKELK